MVGVGTLILVAAWRVVFDSWIPNTTHRYDSAEPFLHPWTGLTWITQTALWLALVIRRWPWILLVAAGLSAVAIQAWIGIGSSSIGIADGEVSAAGALVAAVSLAQLGLTVVWIVLIARSKRMEP